MELPEWLGGHMNKTHIDQGSLKYMKLVFDCRSLIDIGCGPGEQVLVAEEMGYEDNIGIDGDWTVLPSDTVTSKFVIHDFTTGLVPLLNEESTRALYGNALTHDLAWSVEFLEHVEEEYIPNYMSTFQLCKFAVVTYAVPGQAGHHHVNCQTKDYWIDVFNEHGFSYYAPATEELRKNSTMKKPFIQRTGLVFSNRSHKLLK